MSIRYQPNKMLQKIAPKRVIEKLVTQDLTLNRTVLSSLTRMGGLKKATLEETALTVIKDYRERYGDERKDGATPAKALEEAINGKKQLVQRVQNAVVIQIAKKIKKEYAGEFYTWLPSEAVTPDPLHQLNYGEVFQLGRGEAPGDRIGCQCGMEILVDETQLDI